MKTLLATVFAVELLFASLVMAEGTSVITARVKEALPRHIGACVMAIDHGEVIFQHAHGLADVQSGALCTPTTNFRMASVSKQFTATAVLLLSDRGKLALDDTLDKFFPDFPDYGKTVTVKHLLTHSSGLPAYEELIPAGTTLQLDDVDVLQLLLEPKEPHFAAGAKFEYSNSGYVLLGLIVEIVSDKPFHTFMRDELFRPLGMTNSAVYQRGLNEVPNRAYGHRWQDDRWVRADQSITSATRGDGCVYTSLEDYRKWLAGIEARKLLTAKSYEAMFAPQIATDRADCCYGFGWFLDEYRGEQRIYHEGDSCGFRLCVERFPKRNAAVLVQLNCDVDDVATPMIKLGERLADVLVFDRPR